MDQTPVPCTGRQIPNHWATREIPESNVFLANNVENSRSTFSLLFFYLKYYLRALSPLWGHQHHWHCCGKGIREDPQAGGPPKRGIPGF